MNNNKKSIEKINRKSIKIQFDKKQFGCGTIISPILPLWFEINDLRNSLDNESYSSFPSIQTF